MSRDRLPRGRLLSSSVEMKVNILQATGIRPQLYIVHLVHVKYVSQYVFHSCMLLLDCIQATTDTPAPRPSILSCIMMDNFLCISYTVGHNDNRILSRICTSCASTRSISPPCSHTMDKPSILALQPAPAPAEYLYLPRTPYEDEKHSDSVDK